MAAQYVKFWTIVDKIGSTTSNPEDPQLALVATGPELQRLQTLFAVRKQVGRHLYGKSITRVRGVTLQGSTATVADCHGAAAYGLMDKSGKMLTNGFPMQKTSGTLRLVAGVWKVSNVVDYAGQHTC